MGGGIVGLAAARDLAARGQTVCVLERDDHIGRQQTGHNSGVIHAGVYYPPGSLKAKLCVEGARAMYEYCAQCSIPHGRCGKLIVARDQSELPALDELERRARANGVPGLRRLAEDEIAEVEPHCRGAAALHSPLTGIIDFSAVAEALAEDVRTTGAAVTTNCGVEAIAIGRSRIVLTHVRGETRARYAVFCAGAWSDRLAVMAGASPDPRIVPFRGAYLRVRPERRHLVRGLTTRCPIRPCPSWACT